MAIEKAIIAAGKAAKEVGPEAVNLLSLAEKGVAAIPSEVRAVAHIGPTNGIVELATSAETQIVKARAFEALSKTPYAHPNLKSFPQLHETIKTDTLVIGGGMTGLSVANKLVANGVHTVLVDGGRIGETTSKFAGGMITRAGDASFAELLETYGATTLGQYARGMVKAHDTVMRRAAGLGEKVDFKPSSSHQISYEVSAVEEWMKAEQQAVARFDKRVSLTTGPKAKEVFEPAEAVMTFHGEGQINPLKYTKQLGSNARHAIYENTHVIGLQVGKPGGPISVLTADGGRIEANRVVFATGSGGNLFRNLDHCVEGAQCFAGIAELKSGSAKVLGNIFDTDGAVRTASGAIRNRNTDGAYNYFREPADALGIPNAEGKTLLLFGGGDKVLPGVRATKTARELDQQLQTLFPGSKMLHKWNGLIEESKDGMPIIARHNDLPQVYGVRGVGGSGIDSSQFVADEMVKVLNGAHSVLSDVRFHS